MKNISRRVFIKGMAVAAVATAASTVLAGCNLPIDGNEGEPVVGFSPIAKTLTVADGKTADITVKGVSNLYNDAVKLELSFTNKTDRTIAFIGTNNSLESNDSMVNVRVAAYYDGEYAPAYAVSGGVDSVLYDDISSKNTESIVSGRFKADGKDQGVTSTYTHEGNLYFAGKKDWKTMTLVLTYKAYDADKKDYSKVKEAQYVINK